jgi:hypothetical protein
MDQESTVSEPKPAPVFVCPLCGNFMHKDGIYMVCPVNLEHKIHMVKEYMRYKSGEKTFNWLAGRMKVRIGKIHQVARQ